MEIKHVSYVGGLWNVGARPFFRLISVQ